MVEWKKLGDISQLQKTKNKNHITENAYSITQNGLVPTKSFFKEKTNITSSDTKGYYIVEKDWFVYSPSRIDVGSINYLRDEGPVIVSPIDVVFSVNKNVCLPSYLLQYFMSHNGKRDILINRLGVEGTGRRSLPFTAIQNMVIPIPSLQEQERIVGILDTFTSAIENLKKQIVERRKQYEFYRDQLLDLEGKEDVEIRTLGEICEIRGRIGFRGYTRNDQVSKGKGAISLSPGNIINSKIDYSDATYITWDKYEESPEIKIYNNDIVFCKTGSTVGKVVVVENLPCKATINPQLVVFKNISINPKFLFYSLGSYRIQSRVKSLAGVGSVPNISQAKLGELGILILPQLEQQRIVSILDTFEASIANLEQQLAMRQKQYEYYRNKLLTFE